MGSYFSFTQMSKIRSVYNGSGSSSRMPYLEISMVSLATTSAGQVPSMQGRRIWIDTDPSCRSRVVDRRSPACAGSLWLFGMNLLASIDNEAPQGIVERNTVIGDRGPAVDDPLSEVLG